MTRVKVPRDQEPESYLNLLLKSELCSRLQISSAIVLQIGPDGSDIPTRMKKLRDVLHIESSSGHAVRFTRSLSDYEQSPFMLTLDDTKMNAEDLQPAPTRHARSVAPKKTGQQLGRLS